ncbi:MAG: tyrosine-type recombinase/integrase [Bacteroidales bacterium]|nr:tyrosine-type recombinase/integrase [Bacteroidales bacterium]
MQLKPEDIDTGRKLIKIRSVKGKKDRYTLLSDALVGLLREYNKINKPGEWLFEGQNGGQ